MLKIFNTLGRELQNFVPIEEGKVKMYQCGPTVYSRQHIGNMFSVVKIDLIRRSFEFLGYEVLHTRNITDVGHLSGDNDGDADTGEDRMEKGVKRENLSPEEIAKKYSDLYHSDIAKLNALQPTYETPATKYINQMAEMVQTLLDKGFAYATDLAIYFEVDKFSEYNKLNLQKIDKNKIGAGHGDEGDTQKKKPYDFSIWFFKAGVHKNALQTWEHKFEGIEQVELRGFPGWHIECSAMAKDTLGEHIDIHFGGVEHIPIHHTNEIAQSESANGVQFVNYWMHHELLMIDGGKMSKSLGNVYSLDDIIEKGYSPLDYRFFLLQAHYRSKQNFTWESLDGARNAREKLISNLSQIYFDGYLENSKPDMKLLAKFKEALEDDFNIPVALSIVWDTLREDIPETVKLSTIFEFDKVLGLDLKKSLSELDQIQSSDEVSKLIQEREAARKAKNYARSDEIRDILSSKFGVEVRDS